MRRLHAGGPFVMGEQVDLDADSRRHAKVLRLRDGEMLELFDGFGSLARGRLEGARVAVVEVLAPQLPRQLVLIQALAKGDRIDDVVRMSTEIGVAAIHLVMTEHSVARPEARRAERWRRIAREAARQSEQAWTPSIEGPTPLEEAARLAPQAARRLVLVPRRSSQPNAMRPNASAPETPTWLVVGPEGGLSTAEETSLIELGYRAWTLPTGILRTETAAAVALGALVCAPP